MRKVVHVEYRVHRRALAAQILHVIHGLLGERQTQARHLGKTISHRSRRLLQLGARRPW